MFNMWFDNYHNDYREYLEKFKLCFHRITREISCLYNYFTIVQFPICLGTTYDNTRFCRVFFSNLLTFIIKFLVHFYFILTA